MRGNRGTSPWAETRQSLTEAFAFSFLVNRRDRRRRGRPKRRRRAQRNDIDVEDEDETIAVETVDPSSGPGFRFADRSVRRFGKHNR